MALKKCKECGREISSDAKICPNCGKPQGKTGCLKAGVILILIFIGFYFFSKIFISFVKERQQAIISQVQERILQKQKEEFEKMTPAEHLKEAKKALAEAKYNKDPFKTTFGRVNDARKHLEAIKKGTPEYLEAQKLMKEVIRREKKIEELSAIALKKLKIEKRKEYAKKVEQIGLEHGIDLYVKVKGRDSDILEIKYVLMSRPLAYKLANEGRIYQTAKSLEFKKIKFTDGYDESWILDLTK